MSKVRLISDAELQTANNSQKCWVVIKGKVYDVSKYLQDHPGGEQILLNNSGTKDATAGFEQAEHTQGAQDKMQTMLIGEYQKTQSNVGMFVFVLAAVLLLILGVMMSHNI